MLEDEFATLDDLIFEQSVMDESGEIVVITASASPPLIATARVILARTSSRWPVDQPECWSGRIHFEDAVL